MKFRRASITVAILLVFIMPVFGDDKEENDNRVKILIEMLASKNHAPKIEGRTSDDKTIRFDKSYTQSRQIPVYLAIKELLSDGDASIELLLAQKNDKRYSYSINSEIDNNCTVSQACDKILQRKLFCYISELHIISSPTHFETYPGMVRSKDKSYQEECEEWWQKNKSRGLAALQIEVIDLQIQNAEKLQYGVKGAGKTYPFTPLIPEADFEKMRRENIDRLKVIKQWIEAMKSPYRAKSIEDHYTIFYGLPWTSRRYNK